jgi:putative hydrolase of the HAD superfamily
MATPLRALLLDLGEVLVHPQPPGALPGMAAAAGAPADAFAAAYWAHRRDYDLHGDAARYWGAVLAGCGASATAGLVADLLARDAASWTVYRDELWELAAAFRARGGRTAMLSNGVPDIMRKVSAERALDRYFDAVVVSYEVGLAKPDPAIFALTLARLGVEPAAALFVDDRRENVEGAAAAGIAVLHFTGAEALPPLRALVAAAP